MNLKEIVFWVVMVAWLVFCASAYIYIHGLNCEKLVVNRLNNGTTSSICDYDTLKAYQHTLDYCANITVIK